jgi:IS30 family transposase
MRDEKKKKNIPSNRLAIKERRENLWTLLTMGMKGYEIAKQLNVDPSTISRDIRYLTSQSQSYLNDMAKETLPFMYQTSIEGIRNILKECWNIYLTSEDNNNHDNTNVYSKE